MTFPCAKCGLCCRTLKSISALAKFDRGDDVCRHLKNNLCEIYDIRPMVCNVGKMFEWYFKSVITEKQFILENLKVCIKLAEQAGDKITYEIIEKIYASYL
jgi:Fe-S-cluster containining protein